MKSLFIISGLSLGIAFNIFSQIPDFKLPDLKGDYYNYSQIKGEKVTIIDFWATWCQPCVRSIPKLIEIHNQYSNRGVQVIGINVDSPRNISKVRPFASSKGITYPVLLDSNSEVMSSMGLSVLPSILIVDKNNKVVVSLAGFLPGEEEEIKKLLDELISK